MCRSAEGHACCSPTLAALGVAVLSVVLGGAGVASWAAPPAIRAAVAAAVHGVFDHSNSAARGYGAWVNDMAAGAPHVHFDIYVFNVTNPHAVTYEGAKPDLHQIGPLRFAFGSQKLNVTYSDEGDLASYWLWEYYVPDAATEARLDDVVHQVYMPLQLWRTQASAEKLLFGLEHAAALEYGQAELLRNVTLRHMLFGYSDPFVKALANAANSAEHLGLPTRFAGLFPNATSAGAVMNNTGRVTAFTGKSTRWRAYEYTQWNGQAQLACCATGPCRGMPTAGDKPVPAWGTVDANTVRGTYGTQFRQGVQAGQSLWAFEDQLVRSVRLDNVGGARVAHRGIETLRFTLAHEQLLNATENPANAAYFMNGPSGLLNVSRCQQNVPAFVSKPHFLDAAPSLFHAVTGLAPPSRGAHDTFLDVEPVTGTTLEAHERLQVNTFLGNGSECWDVHKLAPRPCFPGAPELYMPMAWVDKWAELSAEDAEQWKAHIGTAEAAARDLGIALPVLAGVAGAAALLLLWQLARWYGLLVTHTIEPADGICCPSAAALEEEGGVRDWAALSGPGPASASPYSSLNKGV